MKISPKEAKGKLDRMKAERTAQRKPKPSRPTRTVPSTKPTPGRAAPSYGMTPSSVGIGTSPGIGLGNASFPISGPNFPISASNFPISASNFPISGPNYGFR